MVHLICLNFISYRETVPPSPSQPAYNSGRLWSITWYLLSNRDTLITIRHNSRIREEGLGHTVKGMDFGLYHMIRSKCMLEKGNLRSCRPSYEDIPRDCVQESVPASPFSCGRLFFTYYFPMGKMHSNTGYNKPFFGFRISLRG